ncbi:MAG: ribosome recycling factor [Bacilli bacterium]|nr:ribosome recycling factor [Bacilli bacterium]
MKNMDDILLEVESKMEDAIESMKRRFTNVRAGRANPAILDGVMVSYYGTDTPLKQLATISVPEARQLMIKPFDKGAMAAIEKGIFEANIGLTPNNNGESIILNIPALTEETRRDYVKQVKQIAEEGKVALRNVRQDANNDIKKMEELTEDDKKGLSADVQDLIDKYNKKVDELLKEKEAELLQV